MSLRFLVLLALLPGVAAPAEVTLPKILASHMVVQRDLPVHVWGMATPGQDVRVSFRGENRSAKANRLGRWSVYLDPGTAGGPFQMKVEGAPVAAGSTEAAQTITLDDVLVGDVWVASVAIEYGVRDAPRRHGCPGSASCGEPANQGCWS